MTMSLWYEVSITEADLKPTNDGECIKLRYDITGPIHQGRAIFEDLNIKSISEEAEQRGRARLGALMRAIGLVKIVDTDQLIGGTLQIKVAIHGDGYEVREYKAFGSDVYAPKMSNDQNLKQALALVFSAHRILQNMLENENYHDQTDSVSWRLADALGLLLETRHESLKDLGLHVPTGRGFMINKRVSR
jgi:hypothetical protein